MTRSELTAVAIPLKSFALAKRRLANYVTSEERVRLAQQMAAAVVRASEPLSCFVVCDSDEVAEWALSVGAEVLWSPEQGLNPAVSHAQKVLGADGFSSIIVAHGDLPNASTLVWVAEECDVTIVPDRHGTGTNVLAVPTDADFRFCYGEDSAALHLAEAKRLSLSVRVVHDDALALDIDTPNDLELLRSDFDTDPSKGQV